MDSQIISKFDWIQYLLNHKDVYQQFRNESGAIYHYETFGEKERRTLAPNTPSQRGLFHIDTSRGLVCAVSPIGLTNQLLAGAHALVLGHYLGMDIVWPSFYTDISTRDKVGLNTIIQVDMLNEALVQMGITSKVLTSPVAASSHEERADIASSSRLLPRVSRYWANLPLSQGVVAMFCALDEEIQTQNKLNNLQVYLDIGPTFPPQKVLDGSTPTSSNEFEQIRRMCWDNVSCIEFQPTIQQLADHFTPLNHFDAVHLRLEDDLLNTGYRRVMPEMATTYKHVFKKMNKVGIQPLATESSEGLIEPQTNQVFVATGLTKTVNTFDHVVSDFKKESTAITIVDSSELKSELQKILGSHITKYREVAGAVDMIACRRAHRFVGFWHSTFSRAIDEYQRRNQKNSSSRTTYIYATSGTVWYDHDFEPCSD
jgi:hypothetical protein